MMNSGKNAETSHLRSVTGKGPRVQFRERVSPALCLVLRVPIPYDFYPNSTFFKMSILKTKTQVICLRNSRKQKFIR